MRSQTGKLLASHVRLLNELLCLCWKAPCHKTCVTPPSSRLTRTKATAQNITTIEASLSWALSAKSSSACSSRDCMPILITASTFGFTISLKKTNVSAQCPSPSNQNRRPHYRGRPRRHLTRFHHLYELEAWLRNFPKNQQSHRHHVQIDQDSLGK